MIDRTDLTAMGRDADPALLRDKPMSYPPAGNPRLFGPGRGRLGDRIAVLCMGGFGLFFVLWFTWLDEGYDIWLGAEALTGSDVASYLLMALIAGVTGFFAWRLPLKRIILRVDDHGLTLRSLGPLDPRPRSFLPYDKLENLRIIPAHRDFPPWAPWHVIRIGLRPGSGWLCWEFTASTATGTDAQTLVAEIRLRAEAAGLTVTKRGLRSDQSWTFAPPVDCAAETGGGPYPGPDPRARAG